jgi:hypothetical protein
MAIKAVLSPYIPRKPKKQGKFLSNLRNKFQTIAVTTPNAKIGCLFFFVFFVCYLSPSFFKKIVYLILYLFSGMNANAASNCEECLRWGVSFFHFISFMGTVWAASYFVT